MRSISRFSEHLGGWRGDNHLGNMHYGRSRYNTEDLEGGDWGGRRWEERSGRGNYSNDGRRGRGILSDVLPPPPPPRASVYLYGRATTVLLYIIVVVLLAISLARKASGDLLVFTLFAPVFAICFALVDLFLLKKTGLAILIGDVLTWPTILLPTLIFVSSRQSGTISQKLYKTPKEAKWSTVEIMVGIACIMAIIAAFFQICCMFYVIVRVAKLKEDELARARSRSRAGSSSEKSRRQKRWSTWTAKWRVERGQRDYDRRRPSGNVRRPPLAVHTGNAGMRMFNDSLSDIIETPLPRYS